MNKSRLLTSLTSFTQPAIPTIARKELQAMCIPAANQSEIYFNQSLRNCKYFQHSYSSSFFRDRGGSTKSQTDRQSRQQMARKL